MGEIWRMSKPGMEQQQRIKRLLAGDGKVAAPEAVLLVSEHDVRYFSGFTGSDSYLVLHGRKRWLVTDARYLEEAQKSAPGFEILLWKKHPAEFIAGLLKVAGARSLGVCENGLLLSWYKRLRKSGCALHGLDGRVAQLRAVKSVSEVAEICKALRCAQTAFRELRSVLRAGMSELEIRAELEYRMARYGAEATAFATIVATGANASLPHAHAGQRRIKAGSLLLIDFGARLGGYNSDLTRTLFIDKIPAIWLRRYEAVLAAQRAGIAAIRAGALCAGVDQAARSVLAEYGLEEYFTHSLGHGLGREVHEHPRLSRLAGKQELAAGNVVTVEPGVYFPGRGGIRIEDVVLVTAGGARVLSSLEKDIASVVV